MATDVLPGEPPVEESRDWNVILGITPPPYPERPEVDPYGGMRLSSYENIPLEDAMSFMRQAESMRRQQVEARAAAIRYEGQVDYERLIQAGTTPDEALRQAGPKMFFRHPEGLTASISRMAPQRKVEPSVRTILDEGGIPAYDQVTDSLGRVHVVRYPEGPLPKAGAGKLTEEETEKRAMRTALRQAWLIDYRSASKEVSEANRALSALRSEPRLQAPELEKRRQLREQELKADKERAEQNLEDKRKEAGKLGFALPDESSFGRMPGEVVPQVAPQTPVQTQSIQGGTTLPAPFPSLAPEPLGPPPPPPEARPVVPTGVAATNVAPSNAPPILSPEDERRLFLMTNRTAKANAPSAESHVKTKEDYERLPSGTIYINDNDGRRYRKP